ncbi:MAG: hypothetical protein P0Y53_14845 [Candidatus Pseudobacter hemicellulosilyticus]|uniref:Uncharacterized protein n=1 Tax=Candidatus Pseudobacter hemicellulosilyticus TaxID=3121375 RepID=A0AAJ5WQ97_9BACT|nr:MAG: hypothetical protein P0Y53_14845 [Pseudobacter sp.]
MGTGTAITGSNRSLCLLAARLPAAAQKIAPGNKTRGDHFSHVIVECG